MPSPPPEAAPGAPAPIPDAPPPVNAADAAAGQATRARSNGGAPAPTATVAYLARDLFFGVRLAEGLARLGLAARQLAPGDDAAALAGCALLLVDLSLPPERWQPLIAAARAADLPVLAFGSHMDLARRRLALEAGATRVVANSQLVEHFPDLIRRLLP